MVKEVLVPKDHKDIKVTKVQDYQDNKVLKDMVVIEDLKALLV